MKNCLATIYVIRQMNEESVVSRILIVDDEKAIVFALEEALLDDGYDVRTAHCAEDGLDLFKDAPADVVLTDMKMPGMSGIELLGKVKTIKPDTMVVIITAYGTFDSAVEAVRLGAFDYIQKPFNIQEVKQIIRRAIAELNVDMTAKPALFQPVQAPLDIRERILSGGESLSGAVSINVKSIPLEGIGADFYDYFPVENGKIVITIGDVSEKGVDGSFIMIMVKSLIRSEASHSENPSEILTRVNTHIRSQGATVPITIFLGILDITSGTLEYVNAGHERPLFYQQNGILKPLAENGTFIGLFDNPSYEPVTLSLNNQDTLLFFTDGLIRAVEHKFTGQNPYDILESVVLHSAEQQHYRLADYLYSTFIENSSSLDDDIVILSVCLNSELVREKEVVCACDKDSLVLVRCAAEEVLRGIPVANNDRHAVLTALYEGMINALDFAYPERNPGDVRVLFSYDDTKLAIHIEDYGVGFDLGTYVPPDSETYSGLVKDRGRGIFLMRNLMDSVRIDTAPGKGTCLILEKTLANSGAEK